MYKYPSWPETRASAVVICKRLGDVKNKFFRSFDRFIWIVLADPESRDLCVAIAVGIIHIKKSVRAVIRIECKAEQTPFASVADTVFDVEERSAAPVAC
jgi:hypothetical protein